jgi:hypothetical protein
MEIKGGIVEIIKASFINLKKFFAFQNYSRAKKRMILALAILIISLGVFLSYFLFFYITPVSSSQEFVDAIINCKKVSWIREDIQASWLYIIKGDAKEGECEIEIQLLKIKKGAIDNEKLEGEKMTCTILKNEIKLPEKDFSQCTGVLKEELQGIIIQRMHNYLLENLEKADEGIEGI